ncbi:MAG: hypothetical protein ACR2PX_15595 [Endozoicomonas sp.]|uniref:hypothetical protein n=1 Tax=Endozoicomonas sp. TaxID=1892382 RepID=UPI003D9BE975
MSKRVLAPIFLLPFLLLSPPCSAAPIHPYQSYLDSWYYSKIFEFESIKTILDLVDYIAPSASLAIIECGFVEKERYANCLIEQLLLLGCDEAPGKKCMASRVVDGTIKDLQTRYQEVEKLSDSLAVSKASLSAYKANDPADYLNPVDFVDLGARNLADKPEDIVTEQDLIRWYARSFLRATEILSHSVTLLEMQQTINQHQKTLSSKIWPLDLPKLEDWLYDQLENESLSKHCQTIRSMHFQTLDTGLSRRKFQRDWMLTFSAGVLGFQMSAVIIFVALGK